jgi:hypothetical protein
MKLLIALLLFSNCCLAQQQFFVKNDHQQALEGVSVFLVSKANRLIGIADSVGAVKIKLEKDSTYLFHLLGYNDLLLSADQLKKSNFVQLKSVQYTLNEISIKKAKYKQVKLVNKPKNYNFGAHNGIPSVIQYVTRIAIEKPAFLNRFKLFAYQPIKGEVRKFQFIIFKDDQGKPGEQLFLENIVGILKNDRMVFDMTKISPFLEAGTYFMGYECLSTNADKIKPTDGPNRLSGYIMVKGKTIDTPNMYGRWNFKEWKPSMIVIPRLGKYVDMGYELEMDVVY